jgi:23S rRNA pseudouridine1911/1915/1917 synthase
MNCISKGEWMQLTVPVHWDERIVEEVLKSEWKVPRGMLHQFRMNQSVKVDGLPASFHSRIKAGQRFELKLFEREEYGLQPVPLDLEILYEDAHLLVVNKPSGMDTHPAFEGERRTLANAVAYHFQTSGINAKVRHIHRLDRDTSGLVLFAKHALACSRLDQLLSQRLIQRSYVAFVQGVVKQETGTIRAAIGRDRHHPVRRRISPKGDHAVTHFQVERVLRTATRMSIQLETGRTHQIRVHLSDLGHPLLGDELYGGSTKLLGRTALHAAKLIIPHPFTGETITVEAPLPLDLLQLQDGLTVKI